MNTGLLRWLHHLVLLVLCTVPTVSRAQPGLGDVPALEEGAPIKTVDSYRFQLDVLLAAEREPITDLNNGYRRALEKLESELQSAGKLQQLLVVREELKTFITDPASYLPPEPTDAKALVPGLEQLRSTYRRERLRRNQEVARRSQAPLVKIKEALQALQIALTKADRIDDALLVAQTIEAIDQRLTDIENGVVPAYFGDPLPKTKEQLEQFLTGTRWLGRGVFLELLPEGKFLQPNLDSTFRWEALSASRAVRHPSPGVNFQMIFSDDFESFLQPPGNNKVYYRLRMPSAPEVEAGSWGQKELEEFLQGSVWIRDDDGELISVAFIGDRVVTSNTKPGPWEVLSGLKATRGTGTNRIMMTFNPDLRSFDQIAPGNKYRATFRLAGKASVPEE